MITTAQIETFRARGLIRLQSFLPVDRIVRAREAVLQRLGREGVWRDGAWKLDAIPPSTAPNAGAQLVKGLNRRVEMIDLVADEVHDVIVDLVGGQPVFALTDYPQMLFTLPNAASWTIPHGVWHLDLPRLAHGGIPGVQVFAFLDAVAPGGGGTLVVAGSHRLLNLGRRMSSKRFKQRLKREPYFRQLMSSDCLDRQRFIRETGHVGEVEVQVVEMCGEPGDAYFMDLRVLHTLAPNAASVPRIMLTQRFLLESLRAAVYGGEAADAEGAARGA